MLFMLSVGSWSFGGSQKLDAGFQLCGGGGSVGPESFRNQLYSAEMSFTRLFLLLSFRSRSSGSIESSRRGFQKGSPALPLRTMHSCSGISFLPPSSLRLHQPAPVLARAFFFPPPGTSLGLCVGSVEAVVQPAGRGLHVKTCLVMLRRGVCPCTGLSTGL